MGASRQIRPERMTWMMPEITRRSSTRGTPRGLFGNSGFRSGESVLRPSSLEGRIRWIGEPEVVVGHDKLPTS